VAVRSRMTTSVPTSLTATGALMDMAAVAKDVALVTALALQQTAGNAQAAEAFLVTLQRLLTPVGIAEGPAIDAYSLAQQAIREAAAIRT
jgi:hypothetical protein